MNAEPLQKVGRITSTNGAEISAFDPGSSRLFTIAGAVVEIQKISSVGSIGANGSLVPGFTIPAGTQAIPNSVSVKNGIVAIAYAIQDTTTRAQLPGRVSFFNAATGAFLNSVAVGALPDMLVFTADGTKVLVANEGEPNSYGQANSVDPEGSVSMIDLAGGVANATVQTATFTSFNSQIAALRASGVRITGPGATVAQDLEPEYISIAPDGKTAWVTLQENNALAVLDIATATITNILPLGLKNFNLPGNGIDASDRDSKIDIKNQPVFGMYMPDAIASFQIGGKTYYITANEGDGRDYPGFTDEIRVGSSSYVLDPIAFPNAATLKQDANLGRLTVSRVTGDTDGDGDIDRIEAFGGRSFSIWDASGKQIYDSGDRLEQITAQSAPALFNSDGTAATFDTRSDNKGPEPEGVAIGVINNRTYAFIGLERVGDVIVYDVTTPTQPQFVQYINLPEDQAIEGLTFVAAADSPTGKPLLVTSAEVSRTVTVYEIDLTGGKSAAGAEFIGQQVLPTSFAPTGAAGKINGVDVPFGGLSGITYDPSSKSYYAISDDRSQLGSARFYNFTLDPNTLATAGINLTGVTALKDTAGKTFALNSLDPEGIALSGNGTVFVSSEGEVNPAAGRVTNPFIKEFSIATGQEIRSFTVPTKFQPKVEDTNKNGIDDAGDTQTSGVRNNLAFESLTISPNGRTLYTATESALFQDGAIANTTTGARSRIVQYDVATGQPLKEYLYNTDPIAKAPNPTTGAADNGLVDLLAIDDRGTLLALERSFAVGQGNTIKIYEISLQGATDITGVESLSALTTTQFNAIFPAQKRLILNLDTLKLPNSDGNHPTGTDNIEGLAFGPKLADGRQSIVLVSDNNFSATQFTQIIALGADLVPTALPTIETTPALLDDSTLPFSQRADADDPAIYVNATDSGKSIVITSVKNGGLRIYDLGGNLLQTINPSNPDIRYNNVDLQYGFTLGGQKVDIAVASDRNNDKLAIFKINPTGTGSNYLENITDTSTATIFQGAPFNAPYSASATSAYGLALYRSPISGDYYAFTSRRQTGDIAQLKLVDKGNGKIGYELVRNFTVPAPTRPGASAQTEGMVVDQETGMLYIGQEDVGIWKYNAEPNSVNTGILIDKVKAEGGKNLTNDVEGLTIYYGKNGAGYLLASSQGDNTFAVYTREGSNNFIGRFGIGSNGTIDSVQESDGADVINVPLGANFPNGLFVTQDGSNDPAKIVNGKNISSNFKFVPFENIANAFPTPLKIDTSSYDPRNPKALPQALAQAENTVTGTPGNDTLIAGVTPGFDGINDIVFAGAGNDTVDVPIAGVNAGNNRIDAGAGADAIFVGNFDRIFGGAGDDTIEATEATDYRIAGGDGNDTLFLGSNGRAVGGNGNDKFYVGTGGGNILSGGAGADQFWIANGELPAAANTIVDFQIGSDAIGISGAKSLGISASTLKLTQTAADTNIDFGGKTIAILTGIQASNLNLNDKAQFVFA